MRSQRIGTIIHGALGDCYQQLCSIKRIKPLRPNVKWIGFFAVKERLYAMRHFELDMLDEIHLAEEIATVDVDCFYQFQIRDVELQQDIIVSLPAEIKAKFDFSHNKKPWHNIRLHDFSRTGLELQLSNFGKKYLPICMERNQINSAIFKKRLTIGYLWRYRCEEGAVKGHFQRSEEWILKSKSELFRRLIDEYDAHILICGMKKNSAVLSSFPEELLKDAAFVRGEYMGKVSNRQLDLPAERCTYLNGLGYAAEMQIMSQCDLLLLMPSGFSEPLWMRRNTPAVLIDPPPVYMAKIWWNRMPFFNNYNPIYAYYNSFVKHSAVNVIKFLKRQKLLRKRQRV